MILTDIITALLLLTGAFFFFTGTLGLLRFPDVYTRLHALTKADNVGLGLMVLGLAIQSDTMAGAGKLLLIWLLVMIAGASTANLIAREALRRGIRLWKQ